MSVVADLHVHTTNSDGTLRFEDLPAAAKRASLEAVAVTDHDRVHPDLSGPVAVVDGVTVVHGIELKVEADGQRVDLLGYGVDPTPALLEEIDRLQRDRVERGAAIVERVEAHLDIDLGVEPREGLGRPHVARAIADHPETGFDVQGAFDHLIGDGRPCFVARDVTGFERGRELLAESCAVVGLAHPLRYPDPEGALELTSRLDAVERWYPYDRPVDPDPDEGPTMGPGDVDRYVEAYDLLPTGGSDAHGEEVGGTGVTREPYDRLRERLPDPA